MASEFDNEMDFLLRQARRQSDLASDLAGETAHLDADDLSAFAENVLPQQVRLNVISHLADCNSCRQILSNLILLNEDHQAETDAVAEPPKNVVAVKPSWLDSFKKLFALPAFGYATATLTILLVGVFAFITLRGTQEKSAVLTARVEPEQIEVQEARKRASAHAPAVAKDEDNEPKQVEEAPAETPNPDSNSDAQSTPMPVESDAKSLPPSVRVTVGNSRNSTSANVVTRNEIASANSPTTNSAAANTSVQLKQPLAPLPIGEAENSKPGASKSETAIVAAPKPEDRAKTELSGRASNQESRADDEINLLGGALPERVKPAASSSVSSELKKGKVVVETRTVGGKTFQKVGAAWQDADYKSQNVTNVLRNSNDYKKLDSGLRSIAQNLSGEIIVVWQGKAYRIH